PCAHPRRPALTTGSGPAGQAAPAAGAATWLGGGTLSSSPAPAPARAAGPIAGSTALSAPVSAASAPASGPASGGASESGDDASGPCTRNGRVSRNCAPPPGRPQA